MQPITPLNSLPNDVKTVILNCLGVKDLKNVQLINHFWQTMAHKPFLWQQVAKNLNIKIIDPKNAEAEVQDYIRYHDTYEVFRGYVIGNEAFGDYLKGCTKESEKYAAVLKYLASEHCLQSFPFFGFLYFVVNEEKSEIGKRAAKQMIQDGVLSDANLFKGALVLALGGSGFNFPHDSSKANMEIFSCIVDKIKEAPLASEILSSFFMEMLNSGPSFRLFLEKLLQAGAQPSEESIRVAYENDIADLVLDYCDESTRKTIIENIEKSNDEKNIRIRQSISTAPSATFGKKSGQNSGAPVKK